MLPNAYPDKQDGINLSYRTDGALFNLQRLSANTKVQESTLRDLLFADWVLNGSSEADLQENGDKFASTCSNPGFTISAKKTEIMHQPAPKTEPNILVNSQRFSVVEKHWQHSLKISQH